MKNSIGTSVILTVFGESHGPAVGVVLDGLAPGLPVDEAYIAEQLARRRPAGPADTARVEPDRFQLVSGVFEGRTTGTPLTILIPNENVRSADYAAVQTVARPSHADYTAQAKYHGFQDPRGGGHFSGRVTAGIVAAGAICRQALAAKGIRLGTHILRCAGVEDAPFTDVASELDRIEAKRFPLIRDVEEQVEAAVLAAKSEQDSVGGVIQTGICGLPAGLGEPWFDSLEGVLARAAFAVGGVKGIEFGDGFDAGRPRGHVHQPQRRHQRRHHQRHARRLQPRRQAHTVHLPSPADRGLRPGQGRGTRPDRAARPGHHPPDLPGGDSPDRRGAVRPARPALRH